MLNTAKLAAACLLSVVVRSEDTDKFLNDQTDEPVPAITFQKQYSDEYVDEADYYRDCDGPPKPKIETGLDNIQMKNSTWDFSKATKDECKFSNTLGYGFYQARKKNARLYFNVGAYVNQKALGGEHAGKSFAYVRILEDYGPYKAGELFSVTDGDKPSNIQPIKSSNELYEDGTKTPPFTGVQYTYSSTTACPRGEKDQTYTFTNNVMCDYERTKSGKAKIQKEPVFLLLGCAPEVTMWHAAGCPVVESDESFVMPWWAAGTLLIAIGAVVGMAGRKLEKAVVSIIGSICLFSFLWQAFTGIGWTDKAAGLTIALLLVCLAGAICGGIILWKTQKLQFFALGICGGFMLGFVLFAVIKEATDVGEWLFWIIVVITCSIGGFFAYKKGEWLVVAVTSFIGAYMLSRGLGYYFGGYPTDDSEMDQAAWIYYTLTSVFFGLFYYWQTHHWNTAAEGMAVKKDEEEDFTPAK